ncbi:RNA polymerase sigma factor [Paraburkholderia sp.]|uniref:RNA polymerase sigma factor n=1 Tax=Paraburkholderia sp. TaxID=1926495 RepID=UPI0026067AC7|nr:RNA polymerase sigma factor [Paraburkholderia sp.]
MTETTRDRLRTLLISRYAKLRRQLEYMVGSQDGAADALQETWLRLGSMKEATVTNADAYLLRMAANVAIDQHRREARHLNEGELDELFEVEDELADPERIASAREEILALQATLLELTPRRRAIFLAATVEGLVNREIAERFGISLSLVEKELSYALRQCKTRLRETVPSREGTAKGRRKW